MAILQQTIALTSEELKKIHAMRPGRTVDLQLMSASISKRVTTEFVGLDNSNNMVFKYPDPAKWGPLGNGIYKDRSIVIRYNLENETDEIIAFKVKVIVVATKPNCLIFTSFPLAIQNHDLRIEHREKTRVATTLYDAQLDDAICDSVVLDISLHGCRVKIDKQTIKTKPKLRQGIKMYFTAAHDKQVYLTGTVMNSRTDEVNLYYGVKFETPASEVNQLLKGLLLSTH